MSALAERLPLADSYLETQESEKIQSSLERKLGYGYNVLGEVDTILQALRWNANSQEWGIDEHTREYVLENEFTAACDAVDTGGYLWFSHRQWDSENRRFLAFGRPFLEMLQAGIPDIEEKIENWGPGFKFELTRRTAEHALEERFTQAYKESSLQNQIFLTVSAYPEEEDPFFAQQLGYKPQERLGKLRFEVFTNGVRQTVELSVARGSVDVFKNLMQGLGADVSSLTTSLELLENPLFIGDSANYLDTIISIVKSYDALLGMQRPQEKYEELVARQRWVREKGEQLVRRVYDLDLELAVSLRTGKPSEAVSDSLEYWLQARDEKGKHILAQEERTEILKAIMRGHMSRDAAFSLKKNELVRVWSIMACVINEERARELFTEEEVKTIQYAVHQVQVSGGYFEPRFWSYVDEMVARAQPQFSSCGGGICPRPGSNESTVSNLFQSSLQEVKTNLFGETTLATTCPSCGMGVEAIIKHGRIHCPSCKASAAWG